MLDELPIIDEISIKELQETMGEKTSRMFEYFLIDSSEYFNALEEGFNSSDLDLVINGAHSLKSSAKLIGALRLSKAAEYIELEGRSAEKNSASDEFFSNIETNIVEIKELLSVTHAEYRSYKDTHNI